MPDRRIIAMNPDSDLVKKYNFGCKFHILTGDWEKSVREEFEKERLTHWVYTFEIQPIDKDTRVR